ncbi:Sds3-like-domain-containing protein [Phyllosticta capitalensis]
MARARSISPSGDIPFGHSATSPPPQALSKRDKRRNMLAEKLADMVAGFSENRDQHYRAQIQAVQTDMALIMRADPYLNKPLDDNGEEVAEAIAGTTGGQSAQSGSATGDYIAQVGRFYSEFVNEVNDALEARDISLTMLSNKFHSSMRELENSHHYKVKLAQEEHRHLSNTLRERLVASIKQRQNRLMKEKEQLDIADSNALLLHPNQFCIQNPASPGGPTINRKTRHTRHRVGDQDDMVGSAMANEKSRKRKAAFDDGDNGSPGPSGRGADLGFASPFRDARAKTTHTQFEAPAYSIERLFTDKELAMNMNTAAIATTNFFNKLRVEQANNNGSANAANGNHPGLEGTDDSGTATANEGENEGEDDNATPAAPEMERTQSYHATRGSTRNNPLADLAFAAESRSAIGYTHPVILPANVGTKANASAPTPPGLANEEVSADFAIMSRRTDGQDELNDKLLQTACGPLQAREYEYQPSNLRAEASNGNSNGNGIPINMLAPHLDLGSVAMSAANSVGGHSDAGMGGVPMSRHGNGSSIGGVGMRRTGSGMGRGRGRGA